MIAVTARQAEALAFITTYTAAHTVPPTVREIGTALGIGSPNGVDCLLKALERKGRLTRTRGTCRNIRVTAAATPAPVEVVLTLGAECPPVTVKRGALTLCVTADAIYLRRGGVTVSRSWAALADLLFASP